MERHDGGDAQDGVDRIHQGGVPRRHVLHEPQQKQIDDRRVANAAKVQQVEGLAGRGGDAVEIGLRVPVRNESKVGHDDPDKHDDDDPQSMRGEARHPNPQHGREPFRFRDERCAPECCQIASGHQNGDEKSTQWTANGDPQAEGVGVEPARDGGESGHQEQQADRDDKGATRHCRLPAGVLSIDSRRPFFTSAS